MTVALIGENNPYGSSPEWALYPAPRGCAGHRLMGILGLPEYDYLTLHRANLCDGPWTIREARRRVPLYCADSTVPWRVVVMLGRKVADAFAYDGEFFTHAVERTTSHWDKPVVLVSLPHPSGRNTIWNRPAVRLRAIEILRELAPGVAWGSA